MITLETSKAEFESNQNDSGLQKFTLLKRAVNPEGNPVYIYSRSRIEGKIVGYEVFIPKVLKAGTIQKFPGGITKTIPEDIESYPHGAETDFGKRAWYCVNLMQAEQRFADLMTRGTIVLDAEGNEEVAKPSTELSIIPDTEFSCNELAAINKVDYPIASPWLKAQVALGVIVKTRKERRSERGPETQLYKKA